MIDARIAKAGMVLALAAFALIVAYNNVVDFRTNYVFVQHVLSMDTVFPDSTLKGRAIVSEPVWLAAYWLIIVCEAVIGVLFLLGALRCGVRGVCRPRRSGAPRRWSTRGYAELPAVVLRLHGGGRRMVPDVAVAHVERPPVGVPH